MPGKFDIPESRWSGIGPYYAMFPRSFADKVITKYSAKGDMVLDPFAGRATSIYSAALLERVGLGIEINPVGWVYGKAKLHPAHLEDVLSTLRILENKSANYSSKADDLPEFFKKCFSKRIRKFLLAARAELNWKRSVSGWTTMALLLVYLHGKSEASLSNQMRQTKSMSPQYAIKWWEKYNMHPPDIDPLAFMMKRIEWRYAKGQPKHFDSKMLLGDCLTILPRLKKLQSNFKRKKATLLLTSPPYYGITNYHYDQWLRLWLLGYSIKPYNGFGPHRDKFTSQGQYRALLERAFGRASRLLSEDAIIYVRTDSRDFTLDTTKIVLKNTFPNKNIKIVSRPFTKPTQTHLFGDKSEKRGERDIILSPR